MARDFVVNGETLVKVSFGDHIPAGFSNIAESATNLCELGLASEGIRITPTFHHLDVHVDDFGPDVPAEVLWMLADCTVQMTLIHYDRNVLDLCLAESMGGALVGSPGPPGGNFRYAGTMRAAGAPMGAYRTLRASGNRFIGLNLASPVLQLPWRFPASYLAVTPAEIPLGTEKTQVKLNWRAIPYATGGGGEIRSSGVVLFDHLEDT